MGLENDFKKKFAVIFCPIGQKGYICTEFAFACILSRM